MSGRTWGFKFDQIKAQKEKLIDKYYSVLASKVGCDTIEEVFKKGYAINELVNLNDEASKDTWGDNLPESNWRFNCRELCNEKLTEIYGDYKIYFKTKAFNDRKIKKMGDTMEKEYGYRNPGQSPAHIAVMSKGSNCKNPFSSTKFKYHEYIRGKKVLPWQKDDYIKYKTEVERLTELNRNKVPFTGYCYYTNIPIYRYDGNKKINRNDFNLATIDHKISILSGFLRGISPEIISDTNNLCWCSKYFNTFKRESNEDEIRLSGMIERFKEVMEILSNESKENNIIEK